MLNSSIKTSELELLKFEYVKDEYIVSLVDLQGYTIIKGYGTSIVEAINDLHKNLL